MKIIRFFITLLSISLLLVGCDEQNQPTEQKREVIQQMYQTMKRYSGIKLAVQEISLTKNADTNELQKGWKSTTQIEFINEQQFHLKEQTTSQVVPNQVDQNEIYSDGKQIYQTINNETKKSNYNRAAVLAITGLDERNVKFLFTLERLLEDYQHVKLSEANGLYLLSYSLKDDWKIRYFYELEYRHAHMLTDTTYENKQLNLKIWVDKQTYEIKKVEENQTYYKPKDNYILTSTTSSEVVGKVDHLSIPDEVKARAQ